MQMLWLKWWMQLKILDPSHLWSLAWGKILKFNWIDFCSNKRHTGNRGRKWVTLRSEDLKKSMLWLLFSIGTTIYLHCLSDGIEVSKHATQSSLLHEAFKDRLGKTEHYNIPPELLYLLPVHHGLAFLEETFSIEEIDVIIKELHSNKFPGPDAFNSDFIKKCWSIIKQEFYDLCNQFLQRWCLPTKHQ